MTETYPTFEDLGGSNLLVRTSPDGEKSPWTAFNPSIMLSNEGEYWMAFRSSNYVIMSNGTPSLTTGQKIRNKLYLVRLNPEDWSFDESTLKEIDLTQLRDDIKRNVEDPRLFWDGKNYCISATFLELTVPVARVCKINLKSLISAEATSIEIYPSPKGSIEKNWMPISGTELFIYKPENLVKDGKLQNINAPKISRLFRGGTQVLPFNEKSSIGIIHELYYKIYPVMNPITFAPYQSIRHYTHRFVKYNEKYEITHVTPKFVFIKEGIEFAAGIAEKQSTYVISFGRSDRALFIATIDKEKVFSMLEEVDG